MRWTEEEVNNRAVIAARRATASIVSTLIHLTYSLFLSGFGSSASAVIFLSLTVLLMSIQLLKKTTETERKWGVFAYYEATQSMVMAAGYVEPKVCALLCMASTTVLATSETSPLYSKRMNIALCVKHVSCWVAILSHSHGVEFWPHGLLPSTWVMLHVMLCVDTKKKALEDSSAYLEALRQEEKRLAGLLQAVPDGIVVLSETKEIIAYNKAFEEQIELEVGSAKANLLQELANLRYAGEFKEAPSSSFMDDVMKLIEGHVGEVLSFSPVLFGSKYLEWHGSVMKWDERKVCVLTVRDSTKWILLEKRAQRENENKTALLRSVSHELRTPTNAILNLAIDLRTTESFSAQGQSDISMVISATTFLLSLINDLLDFSRILHDSFSLSKVEFALEDCVRDCLQLVEPQCRSKTIVLKSRIDPLLPPLAYTDQNRLRQVLLNLLSNALKFTVKGSITVVALLTKKQQMKLSVEDTGIGIKQSDLRTIFTLFGKLEETQHFNPQGCGLGLSISNLLVKKLGGKGIDVSSLPGKGSSFSFCIDIQENCKEYCSGLSTPAEEVEIVEESPCQCVPETSTWSGSYVAIQSFPKILIVDDSSFNRTVAQKLLESQGYQSALAANGLQALEILRKAEIEDHSFTFILMDVEMPGMDGLTATRIIKQLQRDSKLPRRLIVVGCSANFSEEDRENAMMAGMDYFIEKPIVRAQLYGLLSQHFV